MYGVLKLEDGVRRIGETPVSFRSDDAEPCDGRVLLEATVAYPGLAVDGRAADGPPRLVDARLLVTEPDAYQFKECEPVPLVSSAAADVLPNPDECDASGANVLWTVMLYFLPSGKVRFVDIESPQEKNGVTTCVEKHFLKLSIEPFSGNPVARPKTFMFPVKPKKSP